MSKAEDAYRDRNQNKKINVNDTYIYERTGQEMPWYVPADCLDSLVTFEIRPSDVFLITVPKSAFPSQTPQIMNEFIISNPGTTWMKRILSLIMNNADEEDALSRESTSPFTPYKFYIEMKEKQDEYAKMEGPRFMPSHLLPNLLPPQLFEKKPKVIYVARNPKDAAVSMYYHCLQDNIMPSYTWSDFLTKYMQGSRQSEGYVFGDWGSHVIPWWERRHEQNVLFVKYEDMVKDLGSLVREVASFMDRDTLSEHQLNKITKLCTFESMKKDPVSLLKFACDLWSIDVSNSPFVRKGKVGGWKDYFTVAQNEEFDEVYKRWIGDSGLEMDFTLS
ncbi:sulfotransferase 1B1-like [Glandiceps talaboti]